MLRRMRTTIRLDESLLREAKALAARTGRTLTAVIEDGLRETLSRQKKRHDRPRAALPTFKGKGLRPGVDWTTPTAFWTPWKVVVDPPGRQRSRVCVSGGCAAASAIPAMARRCPRRTRGVRNVRSGAGRFLASGDASACVLAAEPDATCPRLRRCVEQSSKLHPNSAGRSALEHLHSSVPGRRASKATSFRTLTSPPWRSSTAASG
jgi:hypothetical protein